MPNIDMTGITSIEAKREDDQYGGITLTIEGEDGTTVKIDCGRFFDDAESLHEMLKMAASSVSDDILRNWEDRPDDEDGYVGFYDGRYHVTLSGQTWDGDALRSSSDRRRFDGFPSLDIATYELARAMEVSGYFPNVWEEMERGGHWDIGDKVRAFHDEGGTSVKPLDGVQYEDGDDITHDDMHAYVVKDYGAMGIVFVYSGDDMRYFTEDRDEVSARDDNEDGDE